MKKVISLFIAAAAALTMSTAVFAEAEKTDVKTSSTITFDTEKALDYLHMFGSASEANLTVELTDKDALSGKALKVSEDFKGSISTRYSGFYFLASDFGLESFSGHTMTININAGKAAAKATDSFDVFSDGDEWRSVSFSTASAEQWRSVNVSVPANIDNDRIGVSFPITSDFSGTVAMIDDITITDNYGKTVANIGDIDNSLYEAPSGFVTVITTIIFILLIIAVAAGLFFFIKKNFRQYR
ncbi:MAG: hypothetical protein NC120_07510 [Ruminococcus sp.]|nr:hypothetical protein [Ruminococcus sp.]